MPSDYPNLRHSIVCPLCKSEKRRGPIVCWSCYNQWQSKTSFQRDIIAEQLRLADEGFDVSTMEILK